MRLHTPNVLDSHTKALDEMERCESNRKVLPRVVLQQPAYNSPHLAYMVPVLWNRKTLKSLPALLGRCNVLWKKKSAVITLHLCSFRIFEHAIEARCYWWRVTLSVGRQICSSPLYRASMTTNAGCDSSKADEWTRMVVCSITMGNYNMSMKQG